jgi:hypothetical protein
METTPCVIETHLGLGLKFGLDRKTWLLGLAGAILGVRGS